MTRKHKNRVRAKAWYWANKKRARDTGRLWRKRHPGYGARSATLWRKKHPVKARRRERLYRQENRERTRVYMRKWARVHRVGRRAAILAAQKGKCAICGTKRPGGHGIWHTDHCHTTKRIRGVLCSLCNTGLGHFKDDPKILAAAIRYLKQKGSCHEIQRNENSGNGTAC